MSAFENRLLLLRAIHAASPRCCLPRPRASLSRRVEPARCPFLRLRSRMCVLSWSCSTSCAIHLFLMRRGRRAQGRRLPRCARCSNLTVGWGRSEWGNGKRNRGRRSLARKQIAAAFFSRKVPLSLSCIRLRHFLFVHFAVISISAVSLFDSCQCVCLFVSRLEKLRLFCTDA